MGWNDDREQIVKYVQARIRAELDAGDGNMVTLSQKLGVSHAHVANVKNGRAKAGDEFLDKIADYWGMTRDELAIAAGVARPDPYPNRVAVIEEQRAAFDALPSATRRAFLSLRYDTGDRERDEWRTILWVLIQAGAANASETDAAHWGIVRQLVGRFKQEK